MTLPALRRKPRRRQLLRWTLACSLLNATGIAAAPSGIAGDNTGAIRHADATEPTELPVQIPTLPPLPVPTEQITTPLPVAAANPNQTTMRLRPGGVIRGNPYLNANNAPLGSAARRNTRVQQVRTVSGQTEVSRSEIVLKSPEPTPQPNLPQAGSASAGTDLAPAGSVLKLRPAAPAQTLLPFSEAEVARPAITRPTIAPPTASAPTPQSNLRLRPASHTAEANTQMEAAADAEQQVASEQDAPARFTFSDSGDTVSPVATQPQLAAVVPARPAQLLPVEPAPQTEKPNATATADTAAAPQPLQRRSIVGSAPTTNDAAQTPAQLPASDAGAPTVTRSTVPPATAAGVLPAQTPRRDAAQLAPVPKRSLTVATPNSAAKSVSVSQPAASDTDVPEAAAPAPTQENASAERTSAAHSQTTRQTAPESAPAHSVADAGASGTSFRIADPAPLHLGSRTTIRIAKAPANLPQESLPTNSPAESDTDTQDERLGNRPSMKFGGPQDVPRTSSLSRATATRNAPAPAAQVTKTQAPPTPPALAQAPAPVATSPVSPAPPAEQPRVAKTSVKHAPVANAPTTSDPVSRFAIPQPPSELPAAIATADKPAPRPAAAQIAPPQPRALEELEPAVKTNTATSTVAKSNSPKPTTLNKATETQLTKPAVQPAASVASTPRPEPVKSPTAALYRPARNLVIDLEQPSEPSGTRMERLRQVATRVMEDEAVFEGKPSETLRIQRAETHTLSPEAGVRRVQLQDREVCEAVLVGPHKLLLIGRKAGSTRLAIWCGNEEQPRLCTIEVRTEKDAPLGASLDAVAARLTETIGATYPNSRVRVVHDGDGLTVIGQTQDDQTAREILRLVRNACLKTVNDRLQVR